MALPGCVAISIFPLREPASAELLGWYISEDAPNDYPRLPVHEGQPVLAGLALFTDVAACNAFFAGGPWPHEVMPALRHWLAAPVENHWLVPTARSALHR